MLTPAQLAAAMNVSTRTLARWDTRGCPCEWAGSRRRYDLTAVQGWNREQACQSEKTPVVAGTQKSVSIAGDFTASYRKVQVRVMPSSSRQS